MKSFRLAFAALCSFTSVCSAQFITGVTATSSMGTWSTYNIQNLTNGLGLGAISLDGTHSNVWQDMWISNQVTTGSLQFDFGSIQPLNAIAVWNYNSSISLQRGVALMDVSLSVDGLTFFPLSTESMAQGTNQPLLPHLIDVGGILAQYVRFDILQNHGNNYTGLSEVQFLAGSGGLIGRNTKLGEGCIRSFTSFYEYFATSASFDLANSALTMFPSGTGYLVLPGAAAFVPPTPSAVTLTLANNASTAVALSTAFPHPGGSTNSLTVSSNGYVAVASGNTTSGTPSAATMLAAPQTAWWAWHDYNPAAVGSGSIKFEQLGGVAYVTWDGVYDNGGTSAANANTLQFQFDSTTGLVSIVFQTMSGLGNGHLVGYSPGGASVDPGNVDLTVALPVSIPLAAVDVLPLALAGASRPVIGSTWTLDATNVPATGVIGLDVFGLADPNVPDLGFLGAPGCGWRASLDALAVWPVAGASHSYSLSLPNDPALINVHVYAQTVVLQPGVNSFLGGAITSNGVDGKIGNL